MITLEEIAPVGVFGKTHGVKGEINAEFNVDFDIDECQCFIVDIDGIFVPFFIDDYRFRSDTTALVLLDGISTEEAVRRFFGKTIYVKKEFLVNDDDEVSISYYVGFTMISPQGHTIGKILSIDDSTANVLFELDNGALVPVAAVEVLDIKPETHTMIVDLPEGLLELL